MLPRSALLRAEAVTLVEVELGGRVFRFAGRRDDDAPVIVPSDDGDLVYDGEVLADIDLTKAIEIFSSGSEPPSISVELLWPVPIAPILALGHPLSRARAEVSRWVPGVTYEQRLVVLDGYVSDPEWGAEQEPVRFSIEVGDLTDSAQVPPSSWVLDGVTWDTTYLSEADKGWAYPVIIGYPGIDATADNGWITGSRAAFGTHQPANQILIIAGGRVAAETVWINNDNDVDGVEVAVTQMTDRLGQVVSVVDYGVNHYGSDVIWVGTTSTVNPDYLGPDYCPITNEDVAINVGWPAGSGGLLWRDGGVLRRAGDVIEWALSSSDVQVDLGRCAAASAELAAFLVDTKIDTGTSPLEWLRATLLPFLPATLAVGPRGFYPVVWRWLATAADAVFRIDLDDRTDAWRDSAVEEDCSDIVNEVRLEYAWSQRTGAYTKAVVAGAWSPALAVGELRNLGDRIRVRALRPGGEGITITATETGVFSVTEDVAARTITITYDEAHATYDTMDVVDGLNDCEQVRAELISGTGTENWSSAYADQTVVLRGGGSVTVGVALAASSVATWGRRPKTVQSVVTYDDATAALQARWLLVAGCQPRRRVRVVVPEVEVPQADAGAIGLLTDSSLALDEQLVAVERTVPLPGGLLGLQLVFLPGRI